MSNDTHFHVATKTMELASSMSEWKPGYSDIVEASIFFAMHEQFFLLKYTKILLRNPVFNDLKPVFSVKPKLDLAVNIWKDMS